MKVCLIVEGAYPYVMGGVSGWIQGVVTKFSHVDFVIQTIVADRNQYSELAYQMPPNVVEVREAYLLDEDYKKCRKKIRFSREEHDAFEALLYKDEVDWNIIFKFFQKGKISLNAFLGSAEFMEMSRNYYEKYYPEEVFSDFLWTMRSMYLPLVSILNTDLPEADIYYTISTGYAGLLGSMAKALYHKPLILSEHGIYTREREEEIIRAEWVKGIYKDLWIRNFKKYSSCCYAYADSVTALFEDARKLQVEFGCDAKKTLIMRNGINLDGYENLPQKDADDYYINVGAILRITPIKDVKTLISAFVAAKRQLSRLKLWIMGPEGEDPKYVRECRTLVRTYNAQDIVFTGRINVKEYIGKMDFLILTSLSEGQPLVILEGFAAKKPCISTNVGNCRAMLEGDGEEDTYGKAGIVTPVMDIEAIKNAMVYLGKNEKIRLEMGETGYKRAGRFFQAKDMYEIINQLFEKYGKTV